MRPSKKDLISEYQLSGFGGMVYVQHVDWKPYCVKASFTTTEAAERYVRDQVRNILISRPNEKRVTPKTGILYHRDLYEWDSVKPITPSEIIELVGSEDKFYIVVNDTVVLANRIS